MAMERSTVSAPVVSYSSLGRFHFTASFMSFALMALLVTCSRRYFFFTFLRFCSLVGM